MTRCFLALTYPDPRSPPRPAALQSQPIPVNMNMRTPVYSRQRQHFARPGQAEEEKNQPQAASTRRADVKRATLPRHGEMAALLRTRMHAARSAETLQRLRSPRPTALEGWRSSKVQTIVVPLHEKNSKTNMAGGGGGGM